MVEFKNNQNRKEYGWFLIFAQQHSENHDTDPTPFVRGKMKLIDFKDQGVQPLPPVRLHIAARDHGTAVAYWKYAGDSEWKRVLRGTCWMEDKSSLAEGDERGKEAAVCQLPQGQTWTAALVTEQWPRKLDEADEDEYRSQITVAFSAFRAGDAAEDVDKTMMTSRQEDRA